MSMYYFKKISFKKSHKFYISLYWVILINPKLIAFIIVIINENLINSFDIQKCKTQHLTKYIF